MAEHARTIVGTVIEVLFKTQDGNTIPHDARIVEDHGTAVVVEYLATGDRHALPKGEDRYKAKESSR